MTLAKIRRIAGHMGLVVQSEAMGHWLKDAEGQSLVDQKQDLGELQQLVLDLYAEYCNIKKETFDLDQFD